MTPLPANRFGDAPPPTDQPVARWISSGAKMLGMALALIVLYLGIGGCESYCVIWPSIDTRFAPGFSERKFAQVAVGMTAAEVEALVGRPLGTHAYPRRTTHPAYKEAGDEVWTFTSDGAAPWGDWAWLSRELIFREGRVVQKVFWT